jgi:signal transduction histidine kinase
VPERLPPVLADEQGVARVLNNLIGNAFKFTPDGGKIQVTAELAQSADGTQSRAAEPRFAAVLVSDTGVGIPLKEQPRVFEKFTQVGSGITTKPRGTGIGLAICREIVEKSNGEIWVQSQPEEGSTFGFTLPLERAA